MPHLEAIHNLVFSLQLVAVVVPALIHQQRLVCGEVLAVAVAEVELVVLELRVKVTTAEEAAQHPILVLAVVAVPAQLADQEPQQLEEMVALVLTQHYQDQIRHTLAVVRVEHLLEALPAPVELVVVAMVDPVQHQTELMACQIRVAVLEVVDHLLLGFLVALELLY
jgi:hypothetical protein